MAKSHGIPHRHAVLLIEDHDDTRDAFTELLRLEGCRVVSVATPDAALVAEYDAATCVVLLDHGTGGSLSSRDFMTARHAVAALADAAIILVSGDLHIAASAAELGVVTFLQKPTAVESVLAAIEKHCTAR